MAKKKYPTDQTKCIDFCICPYCGHKWDGQEAINNNLDIGVITCPKCEKDMEVFPSVEYLCVAIEE